MLAGNPTLWEESDSMTAQPDTIRPLIDPRLANALRFNAEDLRANAAGRLSDAQAAFLDAQSRTDRRNRFLIALFFAAIGIFFTLTANDALNVVLFAIVVGSLLNLALRDWKLVRADLTAGTVDAVEGGLASPPRRGLSMFFQEPTLVMVGKGRFHVEPAARKAFDSGRDYRFYYTPNARLIVGAEALDSAPAEESA